MVAPRGGCSGLNHRGPFPNLRASPPDTSDCPIVTRNPLPKVITPCIGVCSTALGDAVCRGCKRYAHEVIRWNSYTQPEKQAIDRRLDELLTAVLSSKVAVTDAALLALRLREQQIKFASHKPPILWVHPLLRVGAAQIEDPAAFGFALLEPHAGSSLPALKAVIEAEYYALSEAHYERYHAPLLTATPQ